MTWLKHSTGKALLMIGISSVMCSHVSLVHSLEHVDQKIMQLHILHSTFPQKLNKKTKQTACITQGDICPMFKGSVFGS